MNDLLQQFVVECRELIESVSNELEGIETAAADAGRFDGVLRGLHTLKGSAGIVEFAAMERTMHATEDLLATARADERGVTPAHLAPCRACLDLALQWLAFIERSERLPENAQRQADQIIGQLAQAGGGSAHAESQEREPSALSWLEQSARRYPEARARARSAVRFVPDEDSFYQGEDPLARVMSVPGLLAFDCVANEAWASLEKLDPFVCNLTFVALSAAPAAELARHLQGHTGTCDIVASSPAATDGSIQPLPPMVEDVIKAQRALLSPSTAGDFVGRVASAGTVAANALRYCGRDPQVQLLSNATEQSLLSGSVEPLQQALAGLLRPGGREPVPMPAARSQLNPVTRTVRVDAERVEALVRLADEFAMAKNAIGHAAKLAVAGDPSVPALLKDRHASLDRLVDELQRSVLALRVRSLRTILQRFPRLVREIAAELGKPVQLTIEGDATEADRVIVEMLFEPLLHLLRNAIDHGVESPADRAARGKPAVANLQLRARRQADRVLIEVSDDGAGIDLARVREVAQARGLATAQQLQSLGEADITQLIFAPGVSTAREVTRLSGRGVGMDAVRKAVERVGGTIAIASRTGQGTRVTLSLPFAVMMTPVMTVEAGGQLFGLPLEAIIETAKVPQSAIAPVGAAQAVVLRNRTVPLVDLGAVLGIEQAPASDAEATVVVVAAKGGWGGVRVDRVLERLELTLKPMEGLLAGTPGVAGTALLGDGRVLVVLDIAEMLQ